jgi:hypothetical protein
LTRKDPSLLPRVLDNYTIATDDDPHGPRGQSVEGQPERRYRQDCEDFEDDNKKLWANVLEAQDPKGDSKTMPMKCPVGKGIKAVEMLYERYGKASAAKLCSRVTNFVNFKKKPSETIHNHNIKWGEEKRQLDMQGMPLPPMSQCCLYLLSLGPAYGMFRTVAAIGTDENFNFDRLMAKATYFHSSSNTDEANNENYAMWGEWKEIEKGTCIGSKRKQPDGRRENDSRPKCTNCSRPWIIALNSWHDKSTCFAPGGGLAHLDSQARHKYIRDKQKERELGSAMAATVTDEGGDTTEIERLKRE